MKAISIRQPWAALIISGEKDIENRTWPTRYRGPLLIHAAQKVEPAVFDEVAQRFGIRVSLDETKFGGIIGMVDLVGCVERSSSPWFAGKGHYGWILRNPRPLPFVSLRGRLGLFEVDYREADLRRSA